jgi:hypothetical protein
MSDYKLGPCYISFKGTDLGKTEGGVTVTLSNAFVELHTDQDGETPVDEQIVGTFIKVAGNLAEITIENMASILNETLVTDGTKKKVEIKPNVGTSLFTAGGELIIKPYDAGIVSTDANEWITLHKAGMKATADLAFNRSDQRVIAFEAVGYPDSNGIIATYGDVTASA